MAREIKEIKSAMTTQFMSDETLATSYGFTPGAEFDDTFSTVSIESILLYIVACAIYLHEVIWDTFKTDVETTIAQAMVPSIYYYYAIAREFQPGVDLVFDQDTQSYKYESIDSTNQPIAYCAVRDALTSVRILVAKNDVDGLPTAIDDSTLESFQTYMNARKPAGVILIIQSSNPDLIRITAEIQINRLVLNTNGSLISNPDVYPVQNAINDYLAGIIYGGKFNKTKLVDAIQQAHGVVDVTLTAVEAKASDATSYAAISTNNYQTVSGSVKSMDLNTTLTYVV